MSDPAWSVPAKLDGLPVRHWKRRTGFTERGTVAQMVERWLQLAWNQQQECSLAWGPDANGKHGSWQPIGIGAFVIRVGLPPQMLAARSRPPTPEEIERMFAKPTYREMPFRIPDHFNPDPHRKPGE
jgi:hypothetical protein